MKTHFWGEPKPIQPLQSLTGKLQGRITTQGDPCSHYREWVCTFYYMYFKSKSQKLTSDSTFSFDMTLASDS